jgi:phosphoribosylformimino-5-aminoimidazole carboxamide ribotide isomerase
VKIYNNKGKGASAGSFYAHFLKRGQNREKRKETGKMRFRPCIDIHNGKVKQIVGSSLRDAGDQASENFVSGQDAAFYARMYQSRGIRGGHIILLNAKDSPYYEKTKNQALAALRAYPGGLQVGGGITDANASEFLEAGASAVIVTSFVFRDGRIDYDCLNRLEQAVGKEHLVLDLSCRYRADAEEPGYYIVTDRWQKFTTERVTNELLEKLSSRCSEFLVHAVDVEGKSGGIEKPLAQFLGDWGKIPITYAGGVHSFEDLEEISQLGRNRLNVTIGSALDLFGGPMSYEQVLTYIRKCNAEKEKSI